MMFARWRYRGHHRTGAWSVAELIEAIDAQDERQFEADLAELRTPIDWAAIRDIPPAAPRVVVGQVLIRDYVPNADEPPLWVPVGHEPTIVFDPPAPRDRSGLSLWNLEQLAADCGVTWPTVTVRLWLRGDELDDDDRARYERLMGMAGA